MCWIDTRNLFSTGLKYAGGTEVCWWSTRSNSGKWNRYKLANEKSSQQRQNSSCQDYIAGWNSERFSYRCKLAIFVFILSKKIYIYIMANVLTRLNEKLILFQRKAKGQELLDMICQSMNLMEKDYFGLIYEDRHDSRNWLDLDKRIAKFIKSI